MTNPIAAIRRHRDTRWLIIWVVVTAALALWDITFLNRPALARVATGFVNTFSIAFLVIVFTLGMGWITALIIDNLENRTGRLGYLAFTFLINLIRSIPQIVGVLFGYIAVSALAARGLLPGKFTVFILLAFSMSLFIFLELVDLMRERIAHYRKLDFYNAMRVNGVSDSRIINFDILWKNSRIHIFNKLISVFGMAVFLQCSVDFIISVGLSSDVSEVNLPTTLGSLLAKLDSKQDILAVGHTITLPR